MCGRAAAAALLLGGGARAQAPATDPVLEKLLAEVASRNPELAQAGAAAEAEARRIPQAGALPDPVLSLGIQNDGFSGIQVGKSETSYYSIMASQAFPFPGKLGLREQVASFDKRRAGARLERVRLSLEGQVRRAYLDYLLARDQLALLGELQALWQQAESAARARYEAGQAPQSDLLRANLERARLEQRRWVLEADVTNRLAALNRLRVEPLDAPISTSSRISGTSDPALATEEGAAGDAESRSPELLLARLGVEQAERRTELARKDRLPDFSVSAAVMPRGGMEPMWQLGVGISLPIYAGRKQQKAVEESQFRQVAESQGEQAIRQILRLRVRERIALLEALIRSNRRYRAALLPLSEATTRSTLAQYQVGGLPFASVLEAFGSYVSDRASFLESVAQAQRVAIAQREVSLDPIAAAVGGAGSVSMPGAGAQGQAMGGGAGEPAAAPASASAKQGSGGM
jgi:outer membrane protein TolC